VIEAAGVDTWSVCWYLGEESSAKRAMEQLATEKGPRSMLLPESVDGHRVGWFPGSRLLFAEGHPSQDGLCRSDRLPDSLERVTEGLIDRGILPPRHKVSPRSKPRMENGRPSMVGLPTVGGVGFGGVRRLDSTVDLSFEDGGEGLAVLSGVAALPLPRVQTDIRREVGGRRVETVYFRGSSGKRVLGRWYDKGVESGEAPRGCRVRPEDQRRYPKETRLDVESIAASSYVRDAFVQRFQTLWRASKGVIVGGSLELAQRLGELVEDGEISASEAKALAGYLVLEQAGVNQQSRATRYRDRARCRDHGLVLADGVLDQVEIDLGDVLERAMDADTWGCG